MARQRRAASCHPEKEAFCRALCWSCWYRAKKDGRLPPKLRMDARGEICSALGCDAAVLARGLCVKHYQRMKHKGHLADPVYPSGEQHHRWAGGRHVNTGGYIVVRVEKRYVLEHRLMMERALGRSLREWESVHHIDGDKTNNSLENLQLRFGSHGAGQAHACLDCGSQNVAPVPLAAEEVM